MLSFTNRITPLSDHTDFGNFSVWSMSEHASRRLKGFNSMEHCIETIQFYIELDSHNTILCIEIIQFYILAPVRQKGAYERTQLFQASILVGGGSVRGCSQMMSCARHSFVRNTFIVSYYATSFKVRIWLDHFGWWKNSEFFFGKYL